MLIKMYCLASSTVFLFQKGKIVRFKIKPWLMTETNDRGYGYTFVNPGVRISCLSWAKTCTWHLDVRWTISSNHSAKTFIWVQLVTILSLKSRYFIRQLWKCLVPLPLSIASDTQHSTHNHLSLSLSHHHRPLSLITITHHPSPCERV